jgi:hypothetical protein
VNPYETAIPGGRDQAFPTLSDVDISDLERFGERRQYCRGERLFAAGERTPGMFLVLKGALTMTARDGLGRTRKSCVTDQVNSLARSLSSRPASQWLMPTRMMRSKRY